MSHALDLNHTKTSRQFGDITAMFSWVGKDKTPCVALVPTNLIGKRPIRPCVVPMTSAWAWAEETGDGAHCARQSMVFADCLGLNPANVNDVMRVTSIIRECLGDLLAMPPKPTERLVVADAIRVDHDTGKEHHSEIVENV